MSKTNLHPDAYKLLIAIGGHIEKWILNDARTTSEGVSPGLSSPATIRVDDIRNSLEAFLDHGVSDIRKLVSETSGPKLQSLLRAG